MRAASVFHDIEWSFNPPPNGPGSRDYSPPEPIGSPTLSRVQTDSKNYRRSPLLLQQPDNHGHQNYNGKMLTLSEIYQPVHHRSVSILTSKCYILQFHRLYYGLVQSVLVLIYYHYKVEMAKRKE